MVTIAVLTLMFFTLTTAFHKDHVYRIRQRPTNTNLSSQLVQSLSDHLSQHRRVPLVQKIPFLHRPVLQKPPRLPLVTSINRGTLPQLRPVRPTVNFHAGYRTYIIPASLLRSQSLHSQLNYPRHQVLVLTGNNVISLGSKSPTSPPRRKINQYFVASDNKLAVIRNLICSNPRNSGIPVCRKNTVRPPTNPELGLSLQPVPLAGLAQNLSNGSPQVSAISGVSKVTAVTKQATPEPTSTSGTNLDLPDGATLLSVVAQGEKQVSVEPIHTESTSDGVAASLQTFPVPATLLSLAPSSSNTTSLDSLGTGAEATQWINETVGVNDTEELSSTFDIEAGEELSMSSDASNESSSFQASILSLLVPENTSASDSVDDSKVDSLVNETDTKDTDEQSSVSSSISSDEPGKDVYYLTNSSDQELSMSLDASNENTSFQAQTTQSVNETVGGINKEELPSTPEIETGEHLSRSSNTSNENSSFEASLLLLLVPEYTNASDSANDDSKVDSLVNETATLDTDDHSSFSSTGSLSSSMDEPDEEVYYLTDVSDQDKELSKSSNASNENTSFQVQTTQSINETVGRIDTEELPSTSDIEAGEELSMSSDASNESSSFEATLLSLFVPENTTSSEVDSLVNETAVAIQASPESNSTSETNLDLPDGATLLSVLAQAGKQVSVEPVQTESTSDLVAASLQTDPATLLSLALSSSNATSLDSLSTGAQTARLVNGTVAGNDTEELPFMSDVEVGEELYNSSNASNESSSFQASLLSLFVPENTTASDSVENDFKVNSLVNETDTDEQSSFSSSGSLSSNEPGKGVYYLTDLSDEDKEWLREMIYVINEYESDS